MRVAAIYARVSTPGQQEDGTSLETQVAACLESAQELGDSVSPEYILQEQASGSDTNRPLLAKLRQTGRLTSLLSTIPTVFPGMLLTL